MVTAEIYLDLQENPIILGHVVLAKSMKMSYWKPLGLPENKRGGWFMMMW